MLFKGAPQITGVALLTALLWVAFCATLSFYLSFTFKAGVQNLQSYFKFNEFYGELSGMEAWAMRLLQEAGKMHGADLPLEPIEAALENTQGYQIKGTLEPSDGFWDLNARMMMAPEGSEARVLIQNIEKNLLDFLRISWPEFLQVHWDLALNDVLDFPLVQSAAHRLDLKTLQSVMRAPFHTVGPINAVQVNINSAPPMVLAALLNVSVAQANAWIASRGEVSWTADTWATQVLNSEKLKARANQLKRSKINLIFNAQEYTLLAQVSKGDFSLQEKALFRLEGGQVKLYARTWGPAL